MPRKVEVIINAGSGSVDAETTARRLAELFRENGVEANIHSAQGGFEIVALADKFAESGAEIIVAGGGDGTISAVAERICKHKKILGVLPLGTLNNFSKDLQIPQNIETGTATLPLIFKGTSL